MDDYKTLAEDYDFLNPKEEIFKQEGFFKHLIERYQIKTCLDCACGTGWHLFMLDNVGIQCFGSDLSQEMLDRATQNLSGKNVHLKKEDFRHLSNSWNEKFDMVICMTTSFPHMQTDEDAIQALNSMYAVLNDKGIIVIDNGNSDLFLDNKPKFIPARIHKDVAFYFFLEYPSDQSVIFNILEVKKTPESFQHTYDSVHYNPMKQADMERFFGKTQFSKVEYFGNYDFTKYSKSSSKRLIAVAQR
jgi:glycine/sarcosine N-methyltransferase